MKHRILNVLAIASLAALLVSIVLWVRGFWGSDVFILARWRMDDGGATGRFLYLNTDCNEFHVMCRWQNSPLTAQELAKWQREPPAFLQCDHGVNGRRRFQIWSDQRGVAPWQKAGFRLYVYQASIPSLIDDQGVVVPFWFAFLLFAASPVVAILRARRERRRRLVGTCGKCGYDLRASKERCPECGTAVPGSDDGGRVGVGTAATVRR